jgi:HTH-type transcriptional regulator, competence development regulator
VGSSLGDRLRQVRQIRGLSLKAVAEPASISIAYLQKLEGGDVKQPSPNVLHRLGGALDIPYPTLMELAGYVVPEKDGVLAANTFDHALSSSDLSEDERQAVAAYIALLRQQRKST